MFILTECPNIPIEITGLIATIIMLLKIAVPILLVIYGMLDLGKAVMSQKEDEIKKGQQTFFKRLIAAALVFFVVAIAQFVVSLGDQENAAWNCAKTIMGVSTRSTES